MKRAFPTTLKSRELEALSQAQPGIFDRATISAQVTNTELLDTINAQIERMVTGISSGAGDYSNPLTVKTAIRDLLQKINYQPVPGKEGTIEDLSTDKRIDLQVEMNADDARGYGYYTQGQDPDIIDEWPAQELFRQEDRIEKRPWLNIWRSHGGKVFGTDGRMIALKGDPIWTSISRFGKPYPPFDFNSGMWVKDVRRDVAEEFGLIKPGQKVEPQPRDFNQDYEPPANAGEAI